MYAYTNTHVTQANTYNDLPRESRNTGSCTYVFLILCSISVWDLFLLSVHHRLGLFFYFFCFSLYKSEAMACETCWLTVVTFILLCWLV